MKLNKQQFKEAYPLLRRRQIEKDYHLKPKPMKEIYEATSHGDKKTAKDRTKRTNKKGILTKVLNTFKKK